MPLRSPIPPLIKAALSGLIFVASALADGGALGGAIRFSWEERSWYGFSCSALLRGESVGGLPRPGLSESVANVPFSRDDGWLRRSGAGYLGPVSRP